MIPCLCSFLFTVPSSPSAELVGAKLLHLLTQTVLLLKHPTGVFVAVANAKPPINKNVPEPFFKNRVRVRTVWWRMGDSNPDYSTTHGIIFITYRKKCVPCVPTSPYQIQPEKKKCVLSLCTFSRCYGCIKDALDVLGYYFILSVYGVRVHAVCIHILAVPYHLF